MQLFESWVIKTPNRRLLVFEPGVSATFKEMWDLSGKIYAYLKSHGIKAKDVVMYCLPRGIELFALSCAFGYAMAIIPYEYKSSREKFNSYVEKTGGTCGYIAPSLLCTLLPFRHPWRVCILTSEPADGLFLENTLCYECYASTESGCLLTIFKLPCKMNPAPVRKSQSDVSVFILDENDMEVPEGTVGEVCYRNPYVRGYINLPEKTRTLIRGEVFHSGDRGKIDSNGNLILHNRIDDMFKIGGYRIEPDEIANVVSQVSGLSNIVVRGFVYQDLSAIVIFYTGDIEIDNVSMREQLLNKLPEYMIPTNYIHLDSFPLLENGKMNDLPAKRRPGTE